MYSLSCFFSHMTTRKKTILAQSRLGQILIVEHFFSLLLPSFPAALFDFLLKINYQRKEMFGQEIMSWGLPERSLECSSIYFCIFSQRRNLLEADVSCKAHFYHVFADSSGTDSLPRKARAKIAGIGLLSFFPPLSRTKVFLTPRPSGAALDGEAWRFINWLRFELWPSAGISFKFLSNFWGISSLSLKDVFRRKARPIPRTLDATINQILCALSR